MIKKTVVILFLIFLFTLSMFSAEDGGNTKLRPLIGATLGLGASWQHSTSLVGGNVSPQFGAQFGARGIFHFSQATGIIADMGAYIFQTKETSSGVERKYSLHYFYVSVSPFMSFKRWYFSTGLYFGFIGNAKYTENGIEDDSKDYYTKPDIGLTLGIGYMFKLANKIELLVNLDLKYSLNNFRSEDAGLKSGKIFSILIDISILFEL